MTAISWLLATLFGLCLAACGGAAKRPATTLQFPARALGIPLTFQTVVRTSLGSVTLGWPVRVTR